MVNKVVDFLFQRTRLFNPKDCYGWLAFKGLIDFEGELESPNLVRFDCDIFWEVKVEIRFCIEEYVHSLFGTK